MWGALRWAGSQNGTPGMVIENCETDGQVGFV
jgi:hypothetical protein